MLYLRFAHEVADVYAVDSYNMNPHVTTRVAFNKKINGQYANGMPLGIDKLPCRRPGGAGPGQTTPILVIRTAATAGIRMKATLSPE